MIDSFLDWHSYMGSKFSVAQLVIQGIYARLRGLGVECSGSGVELRTLDYENLGSNPVSKPWASFFTVHSYSSLG